MAGCVRKRVERVLFGTPLLWKTRSKVGVGRRRGRVSRLDAGGPRKLLVTLAGGRLSLSLSRKGGRRQEEHARPMAVKHNI